MAKEGETSALLAYLPTGFPEYTPKNGPSSLIKDPKEARNVRVQPQESKEQSVSTLSQVLTYSSHTLRG